MYSTRPVGSVEVVLTTFDTARHHREELDGDGGLHGVHLEPIHIRGQGGAEGPGAIVRSPPHAE